MKIENITSEMVKLFKIFLLIERLFKFLMNKQLMNKMKE